ncbi:MAG: hydantoinase/oxoprolinase family protein [Reyranellaceae bacterium]
MIEPYRIGVDIGGTFTDLVMIDTRNGRLFNEKVLTTPQDPSVGVLSGVEMLLRATGVPAAEVRHVIHGTTLVANALIERKGVSTALVTTAGFRDIVEIGLEWRYDLYDLGMELPLPLVPRRLRYEIDERIGPDGTVLKPMDEEQAVRLAREVAKSGVQAVAVSLLHGFRNADHERRFGEVLQREAPDIVACLSSDVVPEIGEYERTSTTICNAYVLPIFGRYLRRLSEGLRRIGIDRDLYLMLSDGGTVHESTAVRHPIRLVQSGPAGGVQATGLIGGEAGHADVFCFDMGGTTAKACLIDDGEPLRTTEFEVARVFRFKKGSGLPLRVPVIEMIEIGAGGGSIAKVDRLGLVQVGPESSSADPGPACYGLGGLQATVTDADLVLGYLDADRFLGGDMKLDVAAARAAIGRDIGEPLGLSVVESAWAIHATVNQNMAQAASIHALEKARRISDYAMVPIGGAGPVHACHIAQALGIHRLVCPLGAGVASAFGFLAAPTSFAFVRGYIAALDDADFPAIRQMLHELENEGRSLLATAGVAMKDVVVRRLAAMRYVGQGFEVEAELLPALLEKAERTALRAAFEAAYEQQYGRIEPAMRVELVSWRVIVSGPRPRIDLRSAHGGRRDGTALRGNRPVYCARERNFVDTPVYDRYAFGPGSTAVGPAIFEEREATLVVPAGAAVRCDEALNLLVDLAGPGAPLDKR